MPRFSPGMKSWAAPLLAVISFWALRAQVVADAEVGLARAWELRLHEGLLRDLAVVILALGFGALGSALAGRRARGGWRAGLVPLLLFWGMALLNVVYFRFFKSPLEWWVARDHAGDFFVVSDVGGGLALTALVALSVALMAGALVLGFRSGWGGFGPLSRARAWGAAVAVALVFLLVRQSPVWFRTRGGASALSHQVTLSWAGTLLSRPHSAGAAVEDSEVKFLEPGETRARLREFRLRGVGAGRAEPAPAPKGELLRARRHRMGLPLEGPIHVVILFLESQRAYEVLHPKWGPLVAPRLNAAFGRHGLLFTQSYSSAGLAGLTVKGQFATLCSFYSNRGGAAVYIRYPKLQVTCLGELFAEAGAQTIWMNPYHKGFHNKADFESRHGMRRFLDLEHFRLGGQEDEHGWGLLDGTFLKLAAEELSKAAASGPVFAHLTTTGAHPPFAERDDGPLGPELGGLLEGASDSYRGYLSRVRAADTASGAFIDSVFASPEGGRTLLVVLGDHGTTAKPPGDWGPVAARELFHRIPIAFLTRDLKAPQRVTRVAHQIDVAPTLAAIAGLERPAGWLGRDLLAGTGSPFLFGGAEGASFRDEAGGCWPGSEGPICMDGTNLDPLFGEPPVNDGKEARKRLPQARATVEALRSAIAHGQVE
ncbi:MAG: LTA synthase family protein [Bdellovibrionales bacterium]|nr:LTA synthase family protein [Bdellovibrionales bacterium]